MLINEFHKYVETSGILELHQNNSLKMVIAFAFLIEKDVTFYDIQQQRPNYFIFAYKNKKTKNKILTKKWITTWNYNLVHLKRFFRWLYNHHTSKSIYEQKEHNDISESEWVTPSFINIKKRRTKRLSLYSESEIWERDELPHVKLMPAIELIGMHVAPAFRRTRWKRWKDG